MDNNIYLLPANKPGKLFAGNMGKPVTIQTASAQLDKPLNLYITYNGKDIKEDDYIITKDGKLVQVSYLLSKDIEGGTKIVLTTDQDLIKEGIQPIDVEFLEWFVKNPSCSFVEIKEERYAEPAKKGFRDSILYEIVIPQEKCTCEDPSDGTCDYCDQEESKRILEQARKEASEGSPRLFTQNEVLEQLNLLMKMPSSHLDKYTDDDDMVTMKWFEQPHTVSSDPVKQDNKIKWIDPEKDRPIAGQDIIFIDAIGMYKGTFQAIRNGTVYVEGKIDDTVEWEDIYQWIPYPGEI